MSAAATFRIAIAGAGPAGLTLASILHRKAQQLQLDGHHVPWQVELYEAEVSLEARRQGGSLDLGQKTGLAAIAAAGLTDQFKAFARPEGQEFRAMVPVGRLIFHRDDPVAATSDFYSPEIDRADLNRILCESLPHDAIRWGYKLVHVGPQGDEYVLSFANGATAVADLVVGADGAWSRIRSLVTAEAPVYSGVTFLDCTLRDFDSRFPELVDLVGHGSLYAFGGGNALITQRNGYGVLRLYLGFKTHETWAADSDVVQAATDHDRSQLLIQTRYVDWHDRLQKLIIAAGSGELSSMVARPLYALPLGHKWTHRVGVTLIGDAAHLMSPCAGEGVNMAMLDALQLAETIAHALTTPDTNGDRRRDAALASIADFEQTMWERVTQPMQRSANNLELFVDQGELALERYVKLVTAST